MERRRTYPTRTATPAPVNDGGDTYFQFPVDFSVSGPVNSTARTELYAARQDAIVTMTNADSSTACNNHGVS
jgi:hypothetical protein